MRRTLLTLALLVPVLGLSAQDVGTLPAFEVVSIKQLTQRPTAPPGPVPLDRFIRRYTTLSQLIVYAYEVTTFQIEGGPRWILNTKFDVEAKASVEPTSEQMRLMVRRLLAERFSLKVHTATREVSRYVLVKARSDGRLGERLRPSDVDCPAVFAARGPDYRPPTGPPQPGDPPRCLTVGRRTTTCSSTVIQQGTPMSDFVRSLQGQLKRVVVDNTGLTGTYDIELETRFNLPEPSVQSGQPSTRCEAPSIFAALEEQLGLRLEAQDGPVEVLVIDSVEQPTPD